MSSQYPILDNRPIDNWKVTELKEELKRRKLTTKGLKDDLIKRLAEALRIERETAEKDVDNGVDCVPHPVVEVKASETVPSPAERAKNIVDCGLNKNDKADNVASQVDNNDSVAALGQVEVKAGDILGCTNSARVDADVVVHTTTVETVVTVSESVVLEVALGGEELQSSEIQKANGNSKPQLEYEDSKPQIEYEDSNPLLEGVASKPQPEDEGLESTDRIVMPDTSAPNNQVSDVSPTLGSKVKSDSISTDSISINEKIELKDNIIADNVKLELDVVKPEMVEPSSSNVDPVCGESHLMDVEEPHQNKASVELKDNNVSHADTSKKNDTADVGYSEKLNLDRSSGDDSIEEDVIESKQIDSKYKSDDVGVRTEQTEVPLVNEESHVDVVGDDLSLNKKDVHVEDKNLIAVPPVNEARPSSVPAEKRKLNDQEALGSSEPLKRQRRWNSESKVPESQSFNLTPTTAPKDAFHSPALKHSLSRSDPKISEEAPKERIVPPSLKPPTNSLKIDRFLRPFTLKAVQELLGKTGTVTSFWMDQIKTHCYVTYTSVEEATETRNAVYNLQWPPNGGRLLVAEFVDPQEVKMRVEPPQAPAALVSTGPAVSSASPTVVPQPSPRQPVPRQQPLPPPPLPPPSSSTPPARERLPPPPPHDPPIVTLDDLFRKTRATPRIYYLPLSEEQVAAKRAVHGNKQL